MKELINIVDVLHELQYKSSEERHQMAINFDIGSEDIEKYFFAAYTLYSKLADEGHAPSQYWLGLAYSRNLLCAHNNSFLDIFTRESLLPEFIECILAAYTVDDNHDEYYARVQEIIKNNLIAAKYWLELAAEQNHMDAIFLLGEMYLEGKCGNNTDEYNVQMAKKYFTQAQEHKHALAICRLAELAAMDNDLETGVLLSKQAAELGCSAAQANLGVRYKYGEGVEKNLPLGVQYIQQAAHAGHPMAQYQLSMEYINAYVLAADSEASVEWCLKAAEGGYAAAQNIIGLRYAGGTGLEPDIKKAIYWYRKAAAQKWPDAQFNLAIIYDKYSESTLDLYKAIKLYKKAAANQHIEAMYDLGNVYGVLFVRASNINILDLTAKELMEGINDVKYCFEQTVLWYSKADSYEHENAAYSLSNFYLTLKNNLLIQQKLNIDKGYINKECFKWCSIAAEKGHLIAQYNLSIMYKYGEGVGQDVHKATQLYKQTTARASGLYGVSCEASSTKFPTGLVKPKNYLEDTKLSTTIHKKLLRLL